MEGFHALNRVEPGCKVPLPWKPGLDGPLLDRRYREGVADVGLPVEGGSDLLGEAFKVSRNGRQSADHGVGLLRQGTCGEETGDAKASPSSNQSDALPDRWASARLRVRGGTCGCMEAEQTR